MQEVKDKKTGSDAAAAPVDAQNPTTSTSENVAAAHEQAESDIEKDADLSIHSPNDDLDEGELARLGENENGIV